MYNTSIAYNFTKDQLDEVLWILGGTFRQFDGKVSIRYSLKDSSWIDTLYSITYHPKCWSITLALMQTRRPNDTSIRFSFSLEVSQNQEVKDERDHTCRGLGTRLSLSPGSRTSIFFPFTIDP